MSISRAQYLQGDNADGPVLPLVQAITAGAGVNIDINGVLTVDTTVLPKATIVNLGVLESIDGVESTFTLVTYGSTVPYTLSSSSNLAVFLGGVPQLPGDSYVVTTNQVTFASAPPAGCSFLAITAESV